MRGRKKKQEEAENHERWMVSYADFLTLLFAFFTCLYAISTVDSQKMGQMVASMKASFGSEIFEASGGGKLNLSDISGISTAISVMENSEASKSASKTILNGEAAMGRFKRSIEAVLAEEIKNKMVTVRLEQRGVVISLGENGMFDSGSVEIRPEGIVMLDSLATLFTTVGNHIRIEGHADNIPINTVRFPSNWELSSARGAAVLTRMIANYGMSPELLSTSGYGEFRPVASNDTAEGRARNRRVDIIVLNPSFARAEPG